MKSFKRFFSFEWFRRAYADVAGRFPFSLGYLLVLTLWQIVHIWFGENFNRVLFDSVTWALFEGFLLSLVVSLWCAFVQRARLQKVLQIAALCIVLVDLVVLLLRGGVSASAEFIGRGAVTTALAAGVLFLPGVRRLSRKALWHYTMGQIVAVATGLALSGVLLFASAIFMLTLNLLFGINCERFMVSVMWIFGLWLPVLVYLWRIPCSDDTGNFGSRYDFTPVGTFSRNILLPLVGIYMVILYIYGFKILVEWELPTASLTWMVTGLMCVCLLMLYGIQIFSFSEESDGSAVRIVTILRRGLPGAIIPLLVLMSVGLVYRIGEYGITVSRLYVAVFNIWAYAVTVWLLIKKNANLNTVAVSFALVFVAVSIIPGLNLTSISERIVRGEVLKTLSAEGVETFPIDESRLKEILAAMPLKKACNLASKIEYLDDWDDHSRVVDIVTSDNKLSVYRLIPVREVYDITVVSGGEELACEVNYDGSVDIPRGFTKVLAGALRCSQKLSVDSAGFSRLELDDYTVLLPVDSLLEVKYSNTPLSLPAFDRKGSDARMVFTYMDIDTLDDTLCIINSEYFIFTK